MPSRELHILTADSAVEQACRDAATAAGAAVGAVHVHANVAAMAAAGSVDGLVVADPSAFAPLSIQEWALSFLRGNRALLFLLTHGEAADADGLARFVGAQGALTLPVDSAALADRLASPFGAATGPRPEPVKVPDAAELGASLAEILKEREPEAREAFLRAVAEPDTGLYTAEFWEHRLEEEFKRSARFRFPLGLAAIRWEGEISEEVLTELAGVLLLDTRDVDVACRISPHAFVALLPHTGPEGTRLFAERVVAGMRECGHQDLLGEPLEINFATAGAPDSALANSRELLAAVLPQADEQLA